MHGASPCSLSTPETSIKDNISFYSPRFDIVKVVALLSNYLLQRPYMASQAICRLSLHQIQGFKRFSIHFNSINKALLKLWTDFCLQYIDQMKASAPFCYLMALMLLLQHPVAAMNWQGTGDMNNDNLTVIWSYINANLKRNVDADTIDAFNTGLSEDLNGRWAYAWNVITVHIKTGPSTYNDAILYGYAFRNHWMWYNGYQDPLISGQSFSFVIWKDYNCKGWKTVGKNGEASGFGGMQSYWLGSWMLNFTPNQLLNDPWNAAKAFLDSVQGSSDFVSGNDRAYSIVLTQSYVSTDFYGRVCMVSNNQYYSATNKGAGLVNSGGKAYGNFIIFQTR